MPIRIDDSGRHWVEMELLVPGTPEQVWEAMATGNGNGAWFVRGEIEEREGGRFKLDFGEGVTTQGEVTRWQPPHQFAYVEREWAPEAPPCTTEITITARSADRCIVRMVHSLFTSDEQWDDQLEGFEGGWPGYFAVLRAYLRHFPGASAASFTAMRATTLDASEAWTSLNDAFGTRGAGVDDECTTRSTPEPLTCTVLQISQDAHQRWLLARVGGAAPGLVLMGTYSRPEGTTVSVNRYYYGDEGAAHRSAHEPSWRSWLADRFPERIATVP